MRAQIKSRGGGCATRLAALRVRLLRLPTWTCLLTTSAEPWASEWEIGDIQKLWLLGPWFLLFILSIQIFSCDNIDQEKTCSAKPPSFLILHWSSWFGLLFRAFTERGGMDIAANLDVELCAGLNIWQFESVLGKKRMFPQGMISFTRRKKQKSKRKEEKNRREKGPNHLVDWFLYPPPPHSDLSSIEFNSNSKISPQLGRMWEQQDIATCPTTSRVRRH